MKLMIIGLLGAVVLCARRVSGNVSCIGEDGKPVDMFIIYKLPRSVASPGSRYLYLDSNNLKFRTTRNHISTVKSAIGQTLQQVYEAYEQNKNEDGSNKIAHIFYNDAPAKEKDYDHSFGHVKGELAFDESTGFWVIQTVPRFPTPVLDGYAYPRTGFMYGQIMMCVSFSSSAFNDIGLQLRYSKPHVSDSNLPEAWKEKYKEIENVIKGNFMESTPTSNIAHLTSLNGEKYIHFSKNAKFHHDIYHKFVAPELKDNLRVVTWQHGTKNIGPSCTGTYQVVNIHKVSIKVKSKTYAFHNLQDHSKYAISEKNTNPYVCVCDINRQWSQFVRGGGCMCLKNLALWEEFNSMIVAVDTCKKYKLHEHLL